MARLNKPVNREAHEQILRLYIATITTDGLRMTIQKSKDPYIRAIALTYLSAVLLTCTLMAGSPLLPIHPPSWKQWKVWAFYLGGFLMMTLATNLPGLTTLAHAETTVVDRSQGTIDWDGRYACLVSEVESVRSWTRLYNGTTIYRVSLMLCGNRAFHLIGTPPVDLAEQFQYAVSFESFFRFWPFTAWEPCSDTPTGDDNGKYDQFAFAWLLARFLDVPIR